jgi:mannose-1-phosphate guanylyltransferase
MMAGGIGSRFWPRSRAALPKQLINIFGRRSMLQMTYDRVIEFVENEKILVITNIDLMNMVRKQLPELPAENIIGEPFGRNTAPCVALAAEIIKEREGNDDEVMVVLPADHLIEDQVNFRKTVEAAAQYARRDDCLITLGIKPTYPETGYGYIQKSDKLPGLDDLDQEIFTVKTFAEKPNRETAEAFLQSGDFLWNSGMFIWLVRSIMREIDEQLPALSEALKNVRQRLHGETLNEAILDVYSKIKSISIDYGIMENAKKVCVLETRFDWNDVGSWEAVYNISEKDRHNNAIIAKDTIVRDAKNNYIHSEKKLVALVDVENLVVVETDDALLICDRTKSQRVKEVVEALQMKELKKYL